MSYFPLFLAAKTTRFLVIGAGNIGFAKLQSIFEFSQNIEVIAKEFSDQFLEFANENQISFTKANYQKNHLKDFDVIIAATNSKETNQQISIDAKKLKKLVNVVDDPQNSNFIFGANIGKNNINVAVNSSGISPVLARFLKNQLSLNLPKNLDFFEQFISQNRNLVKEKLSDLQARRIFWQEVFEGIVADEIAIGNLKKAQDLLIKKLNNSKNQKQSAIYFIGAGPGDPELLTIKAVKYLSKADVVLYDRLVSKEILNFARKDALKINVGKVRNLHRYQQDEINQLIRKYAKNGNIVARLKGGDPTIFGRLDEEINAVKDLNINYQIIPAISSANGAAASVGIALTARNISKAVRFLTIHNDDLINDDYWQDLATTSDSLVLYMSSHNLSAITKKLLAFGANSQKPLAIIEQATTKFQKSYFGTIGNFTAREFISPSLVIIGDVVANRYGWREENKEGTYFNNLTKRSNSF